jgi:ABC-type lipoprotein release transport system permease subunit
MVFLVLIIFKLTGVIALIVHLFLMSPLPSEILKSITANILAAIIIDNFKTVSKPSQGPWA